MNKPLEDPDYKAFLNDLTKEELVEICYSDFQNKGLNSLDFSQVRVMGMGLPVIRAFRCLYMLHGGAYDITPERVKEFSDRIGFVLKR